jgi:hypothetical protein
MKCPEGFILRKYYYCTRCGRRSLHESRMAFWGGVLTLLTFGLFAPLWLLLYLFAPHWRCRLCGETRWGWRTRFNPF